MKPILLCAALACAIRSGLAATEVVQPLTVAVLDILASEESLQSQAASATALLAAKLASAPDLWLLERAEIDKILGEQTMSLSGMSDPATAIQTGRIIGAKVLITGRMIKAGSSVVLVAKLIGTETSRVFGETASGPPDLERQTDELAGKVIATLAKQRQAFEAPRLSHEERVARLREATKGAAKLPSVRVAIKEQHLQHATIDPAVETEFKKVLLELGFEVVDPAATGREAEVEITGEAISESGARRGQMVAARGRAEIAVIRRSDGKMLAADRQTETAVDIAEAIAGKRALQDTAMVLLDRLVPVLARP